MSSTSTGMNQQQLTLQKRKHPKDINGICFHQLPHPYRFQNTTQLESTMHQNLGLHLHQSQGFLQISFYFTAELN